MRAVLRPQDSSEGVLKHVGARLADVGADRARSRRPQSFLSLDLGLERVLKAVADHVRVHVNVNDHDHVHVNDHVDDAHARGPSRSLT